eukprot:TRINITY_DN9777_c0_g1_i3.p1 TRINITY_DN9777_c0_g1~~TRINITY_DN9777_c0_g1_i3.p1  ORF type:complete len:125 (-),score=24.31 TRINITY_DN9777_c0_g1_i3:47-421(-)
MGDLNYRINGNRAAVLAALDDGLFEVLQSNDQLTIQRKQGSIFEGFTEAPVQFRPTYKYDIGSADFDSTKKQRVPSWTDRILFNETKRLNGGGPTIECIAYSSFQEITVSDHRPVFAVLSFSFG